MTVEDEVDRLLREHEAQRRVGRALRQIASAKVAVADAQTNLSFVATVAGNTITKVRVAFEVLRDAEAMLAYEYRRHEPKARRRRSKKASRR